MSAKVHQLYPTPAVDAPVAPAPAHPVVDALRDRYLEMMAERLERLFEGADDLLFEMSERAPTNQEQRVYFDTMRIVRLERSSLTARFREQLTAAFVSEEAGRKAMADESVDLDNLTLQDTDQLEQSIALSNVETRAEHLFGNLLWELERRIRGLVNLTDASLSPKALAPSSICKAFRVSIDELNVGIGIKLVLYKLFERLVIGELGPVYAEALRLLDKQGIHAAAAATTAAAGTARVSPAAAPPLLPAPPELTALPPELAAALAAASEPTLGSTTAYPGPHAGALPQMHGAGPQQSYGPSPVIDAQTLSTLQYLASGGLGAPMRYADAMGSTAAYSGLHAGAPPQTHGAGPQQGYGPGPHIDAQTLSTLQYLAPGGRSAPISYSDAMLAADLSAAASGQPPQRLDGSRAWPLLQRAQLVGRMFNDIIGDRHLPEPVRPVFEHLRFPAIKTALTDASFFTNPAHPVRSLINELASMAASARAAPQSLSSIEELLWRVRSQFEVSAEAVPTAAQSAQQIPESEIERFLEDQLAQGRHRRQAILDKARRVVAQELELATLAHELPSAVTRLLQSGWAPMMGINLLRHGIDSESWREGMLLLRRIVDGFASPASERPGLLVLQALGADFRRHLLRVNMRTERVDELLVVFSSGVSAETPAGSEAVPAAAASTNVDSEPSAAAPVHPKGSLNRNEILAMLLVVGAWFRVFNAQRGETYWLKVTSFAPEAGRVAFSEFDGNNVLTIKLPTFYDDLLARRSEPIDPAPACKHALQLLMEGSIAP